MPLVTSKSFTGFSTNNKILVMERKFKQWLSTTTNNLISPQIIEHKKWQHMVLEIQVLASNRQAKKCGRVKPINWFPTLPSWKLDLHNQAIKKPAQICFYSKRPHTITKMNDRGGHDRMIVGFTYQTISAYHQKYCEFDSHSWRGVLETTLCDKIWQWLAAGQWFSPGTPVSSTSKTDCHDITEILLKMVLNTITIDSTIVMSVKIFESTLVSESVNSALLMLMDSLILLKSNKLVIYFWCIDQTLTKVPTFLFRTEHLVLRRLRQIFTNHIDDLFWNIVRIIHR